MVKIIKSYLIDKTRPLRFCRNVKLDEKYRKCYKFPKIIKDNNLNIVSVKYHYS